jgi:UDP-glucose 4-epimerase
MGWPARRSQRQAATRVIEGSKAFLRAAQAAAVPKVIVANSAALYGVQPVGPVPESAPVYGHQMGSFARARALVSDYVDLLADAFPVLTRLRVAWVCGPLHLGLVRYFTSNPVLVCGYEDRGLQVVHESDLIAAFTLAIQRDLPGVYNVGSPEMLTFRDLAALVGQNRTCVPLAWQTLRAWVAWRWLERRTPPVWVRLLYRGFPVDPGKLIAAGWVPQYTPRTAMIEALNVYRAGV